MATPLQAEAHTAGASNGPGSSSLGRSPKTDAACDVWSTWQAVGPCMMQCSTTAGQPPWQPRWHQQRQHVGSCRTALLTPTTALLRCMKNTLLCCPAAPPAAWFDPDWRPSRHRTAQPCMPVLPYPLAPRLHPEPGASTSSTARAPSTACAPSAACPTCSGLKGGPQCDGQVYQALQL